LCRYATDVDAKVRKPKIFPEAELVVEPEELDDDEELPKGVQIIGGGGAGGGAEFPGKGTEEAKAKMAAAADAALPEELRGGA
jgi:hypothetical protein